MMDKTRYMEVTHKVMSDRTSLPVYITIRQAWELVSALQLATRHPGVSELMKHDWEDIARTFQGAITALHPEAQEPLEYGWDAWKDVPSTRQAELGGKVFHEIRCSMDIWKLTNKFLDSLRKIAPTLSEGLAHAASLDEFYLSLTGNRIAVWERLADEINATDRDKVIAVAHVFLATNGVGVIVEHET